MTTDDTTADAAPDEIPVTYKVIVTYPLNEEIAAEVDRAIDAMAEAAGALLDSGGGAGFGDRTLDYEYATEDEAHALREAIEAQYGDGSAAPFVTVSVAEIEDDATDADRDALELRLLALPRPTCGNCGGEVKVQDGTAVCIGRHQNSHLADALGDDYGGPAAGGQGPLPAEARGCGWSKSGYDEDEEEEAGDDVDDGTPTDE